MRLVVVVVAALMLPACSLTATMVPVEGPLSQNQPVPVLRVKVDGIWGNAGGIAFNMPGGESCSGRWASAADSGQSTVSSVGLLTKYGTAYGTGYSYTTGSGQNPGQALVTCSGGRTVQMEFVTGAGTGHGFGIGRDNLNNVYRFVF